MTAAELRRDDKAETVNKRCTTLQHIFSTSIKILRSLETALAPNGAINTDRSTRVDTLHFFLFNGGSQEFSTTLIYMFTWLTLAPNFPESRDLGITS